MTSYQDELPHKPDLNIENHLWEGGITYIAGIDEAGRGALAGPVSVGALVLPPDLHVAERLEGVRDSKLMSPQDRLFWAEEIKACAVAWSVGFAQPEEIDRVGIVPAVYLAAERALNSLTLNPEHLLIDYFTLPDNNLPQTALVHGDRLSLSIAAASVLAKTTRDLYMEQLDQDHPGYGFARHKGYGTLAHRQAIAELGTCLLHRKSFNYLPPDDLFKSIDNESKNIA